MGLFSRLRTEPVYNTRAVVQRTGVPADTFRAWERRYGLPHPARTEGNQRLYSDRDIATIAWLRDQTRAGMSISRAVQLYRNQDVLGERRDEENAAAAGREPSKNGEADRLAGFRDEVVEALLGFDAVAADRAVEEATALLSVEDVCLHVLQPALYEIGDRWARGEIEVSGEHFASAFVIRKLGALFNLSQPEVGRGPIVAACLEGELHEVGLLLTCLFLSRRGFRILYLGANLPLDDLLRTIERIRPPLVLVSASITATAERLAAATRELRRRWEEIERTTRMRCPTIGYGGHVFLIHPELREGIDGTFLGRNAEEAVGVIDQVLKEWAV